MLRGLGLTISSSSPVALALLPLTSSTYISSRSFSTTATRRNAAAPPPIIEPAVKSAKRISQAKQKPYYPGIRRDIRKFEGEHTFNLFRNSLTLVSEAKGMVVIPAMFGAMSLIKYFVPLLPPFVDTWTFFGLFCMTSMAASRLAVRGRPNKVRVNLTGKNVLITGATSGIGLEAAVQFAKLGANVHVVSRRTPHGEAAMKRIEAAAVEGAEIKFSAVDFVDLVAVRDFARKMRFLQQPIDILVNNAAILHSKQITTKYGDDEMLVVNLLAPYLLTEGLLPLVERASGRIVHVSSGAHVAVKSAAVQKYLAGRGVWSDKTKFDGLEQYGFTKLGIIFHAQQLALRSYPPLPKVESRQMQAAVATGAKIMDPTQQEPKFTVCSLHPGGVVTPIYRYIPMAPLFKYLYYPFILFLKTPYEGSQTVVNAALRADIVNGGFYMDCKYLPTALSQAACDVKERTTVLDWVNQKMQPYMKWD